MGTKRGAEMGDETSKLMDMMALERGGVPPSRVSRLRLRLGDGSLHLALKRGKLTLDNQQFRIAHLSWSCELENITGEALFLKGLDLEFYAKGDVLIICFPVESALCKGVEIDPWGTCTLDTVIQVPADVLQRATKVHIRTDCSRLF
jgi:hypothetical protein